MKESLPISIRGTDQVNVFLLGRNHVGMYKIMMSVAEIRGSSLDVQKFNESCFEQYLTQYLIMTQRGKKKKNLNRRYLGNFKDDL